MNRPDESSTNPTLLGRMRKKDPQAWGDFVRKYGPLLHANCQRFALKPEDIEDLLQELYVRLLGLLDRLQYDPTKRFRGLLTTMVKNLCIDFCRKHKKTLTQLGGSERPLEEIADPSSLEQVVLPALEREMMEEVCQRVQLKVEPRNWRMFQLRFFEGRSAREVAREVGLNTGHALRLLKEVRDVFAQVYRHVTGEDFTS